MILTIWVFFQMKTLLATLDSSEFARTSSRRCYPHAGNGGHRWCLSSSLCFKDEAMDVARSAPQGAHYHADVINFLT